MQQFASNYRKKNLLLLGASGGVASAFLNQLTPHRNVLDTLVLVDMSDKVLSHPYLDHKTLNYVFLKKKVILPQDKNAYISLLKKYNIDVVLDLTDMDSIPVLEITNEQGVSYINTAMNAENEYVSDLVFDIYARKEQINNAKHIVCTGMNPGVVNMWVKHGIEQFGLPEEVIHFEYDTSILAKGWQPMMTWSLHEFIVEISSDPSGILLGRDKLQQLFPNALGHRVDLTEILSPIMQLDTYPKGFRVLHEENLSIAQQYNIPSQFIYAFNMQTMDALVKLYEKKKEITQLDLIHGDNTTHPLVGADLVGVLLKYKDKKVYYVNAASNSMAVGTSGTYTQVVVGVLAALFVLLFDTKLANKVYFVEDLYHTYFTHHVFDTMRVEEYIFSDSDNKLQSYTPSVSLSKTYEEFINLAKLLNEMRRRQQGNFLQV